MHTELPYTELPYGELPYRELPYRELALKSSVMTQNVLRNYLLISKVPGWEYKQILQNINRNFYKPGRVLIISTMEAVLHNKRFFRWYIYFINVTHPRKALYERE